MRTIPVGSDLVEVGEYHIVIHARHPIADWKIREFCRQPIYFKGQKFVLRNRLHGKAPHAVQYELVPWPEDLHDESSASFVYDEQLVAQRDADFKAERQRTVLWYFILPLYPLLGLFWSGFKRDVLSPLGFVPTSITSASVLFIFLAVFVDAMFLGFLGGGILMVLFGVTALGGWIIVADLLVIAAFLLDCAVRFSQLLQGDAAEPFGLLEWLLPSRRSQSGRF